ncbi:MAG: hypothetical protein ACKVHO_10445 [Verrucomicrobiia bacterium]
MQNAHDGFVAVSPEVLCTQLSQLISLQLIDGSSVQIPDNHATYPLPSGKTEGCGFPVISLVDLIDLNDGNRLFSSYEVVAHLQNKGEHFIGRNHQSRKLNFRCGTKIGPNERLQVWGKPKQHPPQSRLSAERWQALPDTRPIRIIRTQVYSDN